MTKTVVTRFAPSPTGYLHIGGARTALFNYLYAKHMGGQFVLRIEDTDRERSTPESVQAIFDGLKWLGIPHDGDVVFQSAREARHVEAVQYLLDKGRAYRCYLTKDELEAMRVKGKAFRSPHRDEPGWEPPTDDRPFVVRFKGPTIGRTNINDMVKGSEAAGVWFDNSTFDDLILLRSDGSPTYNLAVVVDDHDMGVTHVIRGDDHLNNAGRQTLLYEALDWEIPVFGHVPLILNPEGKPLSKRNGDAAVSDYAALGYLPEGMRNYLTRLGWGHGDDEIFSDAQAIEWFDVADVVTSPARFDFKKLDAVNQHYINAMDDVTLSNMVIDILNSRRDEPLNTTAAHAVMRVVPLIKMGTPTVVALANAADFATVLDQPLTDKVAAMLEDDVVKHRLSVLTSEIMLAPWNVDSLNEAIRGYVHVNDLKMKDVGPLLRGVLTGLDRAPDLGICLVAIGRERSLARLNDVVNRLTFPPVNKMDSHPAVDGQN
jgi:glutamyl-tRNA synthetase